MKTTYAAKLTYTMSVSEDLNMDDYTYVVVCPKCSNPLTNCFSCGYDKYGTCDGGSYNSGRWSGCCDEHGVFVVCLDASDSKEHDSCCKLLEGPPPEINLVDIHEESCDCKDDQLNWYIVGLIETHSKEVMDDEGNFEPTEKKGVFFNDIGEEEAYNDTFKGNCLNCKKEFEYTKNLFLSDI